MLIVKPYGRSHVEPDDAFERKRILRQNNLPDQIRNIEDFALSHDELIIAQWISSIDKIATKPSGNNGPTDEQRCLRQNIGNAAFGLLRERKLLPGLKKQEIAKHLELVWQSKIAPYGKAKYRPKRGGNGPLPLPSAKGRWFQRFAGSCNASDVNGPQIAQKIYEHLHVAEYRINQACPNKREGRIPARAKSISDNILSSQKRPTLEWSEGDEECYFKRADVAREIFSAAKNRIDGSDKGKPTHVTLDIAGEKLFAHYARVFTGADGTPLSIAESKQQFPRLFDLHMAVKDCYSRLLKNHGKTGKQKAPNILHSLPVDKDALLRLIKAMRGNRDVNALIRLGKVIHYQAFESQSRSHQSYKEDWPTDIDASRYWSSTGQAEIKRNEAFVRVWRHVLALAQRTVTDWVAPFSKDILLSAGKNHALKNFDPDRFKNKLDLLFGNQARLFNDPDIQKGVLEFVLENTAQLRHKSFHFTGRNGFSTALHSLGGQPDKVVDCVKNLWDQDLAERANRLHQTMIGVKCDYFFDKTQAQVILDALIEAEGSLPLPRFNRTLKRAHDTWNRNKPLLPLLPDSANRNHMENPAILCRYTVLKLLYERPFRAWLDQFTSERVNLLLDRAIKRATADAQTINGKNQDSDTRALIVSRASHLPRPTGEDAFRQFFFDLSASTATEMRVQRGYESDSDQAREQAGFIEDLRCEVLSLAFSDFLVEYKLQFVSELSAQTPLPKIPQVDLGAIATPKAFEPAQAWEATLYFLLHLVPVDQVGKLLHQIRKWEILAAPSHSGQELKDDERKQAARLQEIMSLYPDWCDGI
jgi:hypothetical protein